MPFSLVLPDNPFSCFYNNQLVSEADCYSLVKKGHQPGDLAGHLGTKGPAIGRYERDEMKPSIDIATKMANVVGV